MIEPLTAVIVIVLAVLAFAIDPTGKRDNRGGK